MFITASQWPLFTSHTVTLSPDNRNVLYSSSHDDKENRWLTCLQNPINTSSYNARPI